MKKVLMILGFVFIVLVGGFIGLLALAQITGGQMQEEFFDAVLSGDPKQVTALFHPALIEEVDEPVLAAWMQCLKAERGDFKGLRKTYFHTSTKYEGGAKITESRGTVDFQKGPVQSELGYRDGKLIRFHIDWDGMPNDWFKGPIGTELYRRRGDAFLRAFLEGQADEAFAMMHPALKRAVPLEKLTKMIQRVTERAGALKSVVYDSEELQTADTVRLKVFYKVVCEKAETTASADFQFVDLKGHLIAFNLTGEED